MELANGDIVSVVVTFATPAGDDVQNKFTFRYDGTGMADSTFIGLVDSELEDFYELGAAYFKSTITSFITEYDRLDWDDVLKKWYTAENIGMGGGTVTFTDLNALLPYQIAGVPVGLTGKPKSRGRKWIGLWCEDAQDNSKFVSGVATILTSMLAWYISAQILQTNHSIAPGVVSDKWELFLPFVTGLVRDICFTRKSRTRGRGS